MQDFRHVGRRAGRPREANAGEPRPPASTSPSDVVRARASGVIMASSLVLLLLGGWLLSDPPGALPAGAWPVIPGTMIGLAVFAFVVGRLLFGNPRSERHRTQGREVFDAGPETGMRTLQVHRRQSPGPTRVEPLPLG